ncbi:putative bifunctional diguanylate cyclase/phosphodiesterase [Longispora albida]|uniref:putative bifunctional diguanylate cyclase/phosphodiesterase n=1 Tax=Longispora albida TaxID=203523 RepID=UPI00035CCA14|nr:sensor domain-containing phosphodiesterase [Longispora albida]
MRNAEAKRDTSEGRLWLATAAAVLCAVALILPVAYRSEHEVEPLLAVLFFVFFSVAERTFLTVEFRRQVYGYNAVEFPLLLALFYLPPIWVVITRVLGVAVSYGYRQQPVKALFNIAQRGAGTAVAGLVILPLAGKLDVTNPVHWIVLIGAAEAGSLVSMAAVAGVLTIAQGWMGFRSLARVTLRNQMVCTVNAIIGLIVLLALNTSLWAIACLIVLGGVVGAAYRAYQRSLQQHRSLTELYDFTQAAAQARESGNLADVLLVRARKLLNAEYATLWLPETKRHPEVLLTARIDDKGLSDRPVTPTLLRARAMEVDKTLVVGPKTGDADLRALLVENGKKDVIAVPLRSGTAVIGTLEVVDRVGDLNTFDPHEVRLLETLAAHVAVAVENSRLVDRLRFDAYHDSLTGLPNRRRMIAMLEEAVKISAPDVVAVLLFDVDGMRDVNESMGHQAGDKLLAEVAHRLRELAPAAALVARVGGDKFTVMLRVETTAEAVELAGKLRAALQEPMRLGTLNLDVDTAVGLAMHPEHGSEPEVLLRRADLAVHAAKQTNSHIQPFHLALESGSTRRIGLAGDLRRALDSGELEVYFQPKVALADRRLVGVECLARWEHPAHGSVSPGDFIAVAEHTGQLGRLTEVVLREGLRRCREWADEGRPLTVAVNLSPRTLIDPDFPAQVGELLTEYGVPPERLTLEITEDGMVAGPDRPMPTLHRLHDLGVRLSVDDFGTGYSSLSYLRRLPVHEVKVDRMFVQGMATDPGDLAIVRAVVDLSRHFGLSVVAEGVESELTLALLEEMGCDVGQGFLFSRPLPYERLETWFAAQTITEEASFGGAVRRLRAVP